MPTTIMTASKKRNGGDGPSTSQCSRNSETRVSGKNGLVTSASNGINKSKDEKLKLKRLRETQEEFLSKLERPTQIYRMLRGRMLESPIFLQRNLSYMRGRIDRSQKCSMNTKVDKLFGIQEEDSDSDMNASSSHPEKNNCHYLSFTGFHDGNIWLPDTEARIDVFITRVCTGRRKELRNPLSKIYENMVKITIPNTSKCSPAAGKNNLSRNGSFPFVLVPTDCLKIPNGLKLRSYQLILKITAPRVNLCEKTSLLDGVHAEKDKSCGCDESSESIPKSQEANTDPTLCCDPRTSIGALTPKSSSMNDETNRESVRQKDKEGPNVIYAGQIVISGEELVINGLNDRSYEVRLRPLGPQLNDEIRNDGLTSNFSTCQPYQGISWIEIDENHPKLHIYHNKTMFPAVHTPKIYIELKKGRGGNSIIFSKPAAIPGIPRFFKEVPPQRIIYQFLEAQFTPEMTEARNDMYCPWCNMNCKILYSLLKHLRFCHPRLRFLYQKIENGARILVSINRNYDSSFSGHPLEDLGFKVNQDSKEPFQKLEMTQILIHPSMKHKVTHSLTEFEIYDKDSADQKGHMVIGHERIYHHTTTCMPIKPEEMEIDSEGEPDPEWLREKTVLMIDEFTDVNEGEKELMKLWNIHVMKFNYVGDCQIPTACRTFVDLHGEEIVKKNIYRNFILHLTNLFEFGLLSSSQVHAVTQQLQDKIKVHMPSLKANWEKVNNHSSNAIDPYDYLKDLGLARVK